MHVAAQRKQQPEAEAPRYKAVGKLERASQQQMEEMISRCDDRSSLIPADLRFEAMQLLRSPAQRAILNALEVRTPEIDEDFGYEWEDALLEMNADPARSAATDLFLRRMPSLDAILADPAIQQRSAVEWLYDQTVGRFAKVTPYLGFEEQELQRWKEKCPEACRLADDMARRLSQRIQDNTRPSPSSPPSMSNEARDLSCLAHMIAARKLYLIATGVGEFFEGASTFADVSVPAHLKDALGDTKVYVRLGTRAKSFAYQVANQDQMRHFGQMIGPQSQMLNNLQEKVMPWTSRKGMGQKVDGNMMAQVYYGIVRKEPAKEQIHGPTLEALKGDRNLYRALGFRDDLAAQQAAVLERLVAGGSLRDFLDRPSVQSEFRRNRIDKSLVEASLNAEIIQVLLEAFKQWKPDLPVKGTGPVENARSIFPALWKDMAAYHSALLEKDYISVRRLPFFKPTLEKAYEEGLPPKERAKRESFYKPVAVALVAKREANASPVPESWKALETYVDPVTGGEFSDYQIDTPAGTGIVCLIKGGSPEAARHAVDGLLNPRGEPLINDPKERIKGVRISELFFNELKSSCLHPHSIARTQFYTSFSMADSLRFLRGTSKEPTVEMVVEALKPCSIFRYSDEYCRVKPSEMVRVKYRTPTGEAQNPCWDASATLGGLNEARMQERFSDAKWSLVLIEGEKKAALLAQMMQDWKLPFHVIAIPGVWMAMKGSKGNRVLSEFFDKFVMRDALGNHRKCLVFFDNDKAYNVSVTQAMVETAVCMQAKGGDVFIPNLPFGKKVKGADDFAQARCRKEDGIDYQPLVDIIDNAVYVPVKAFPIKHQTSDQQRQVKRFMYQAERVHELQQALRKSADPVHSKEFPQLVVLLAPYVLGGKERQALETFNAMNEEGKTALLERVLKDNPCLKQLKHSMAAHIPNFDSGTALKDFQEENVARSPNAQAKPFVFSEDFFAIG